MKLTEKQQAVLGELRKISRANAYLYRESQPFLHERDRENLAKGDQYCVFGMGGLTFQVSRQLGVSTSSVLGVFKALRRKGMVICEEAHSSYQRPRYWWPTGLAADLVKELSAFGGTAP